MRAARRLVRLAIATSLAASVISTEHRTATADHAFPTVVDQQEEASSSHLRNAAAHPRHQRRDQSTYRSYRLWEPKEISETLLKWKTHYPDFIRVSTGQESFGLPRAGTDADCPHDEGGDGCLNYYFTLQDYVAHPEGSDSDKRLPEILWSGELHGNEQVGPTAVLEASQLLMDAALCESFPRVALRGTDSWENELVAAKNCRDQLEASYGISSGQRQWLARLLTTRRIVVVPTANALGYYRKVREEGNIDPNRDFPFDLTDPTVCMQTIAGRTLNELFRLHMFQLSFTFHGGMEVIGYEWGAPTYSKSRSPDDTAQTDIASTYSRYGGGWADSSPYHYGDMNSQVYPVRGGMEDWAYAGSWDPDRVIQCQPTTFGGYDAQKTVYGPSTLRTFNMLVESSDEKIPPENMLGTSQDLLLHDSAGTGYVSRNIRLCLMSGELVEPYVVVSEVNELVLTDDLVPMVDRGGTSCQQTKAVSVPSTSRKVVIQWIVGGALTVDDTKIWYAKWSDVPSDKLNCASQPDMDDVSAYFKEGTPISATSGYGRFNVGQTSQPPFSASIDITGFGTGDRLVVIASARVDQNWVTTQVDNVQPPLPPQSHVVNVRTNSSWHHECEGKIIQGRVQWFSTPLTLVLRDDDEDKSGDPVAVELSSRYTNVSTSDAGSKGGDSTSPSSGQPPAAEAVGRSLETMLILVGIAAVILCAGSSYVRHRMRLAQRSRVRDFIEDESAPSPGLRNSHKTAPNGSGTSNGRMPRANGYTDIPDDRGVELT